MPAAFPPYPTRRDLRPGLFKPPRSSAPYPHNPSCRNSAALPCRTSAPTWPCHSAAAPPLQLPALAPPRCPDAHQAAAPTPDHTHAGISREATVAGEPHLQEIAATGDLRTALTPGPPTQGPYESIGGISRPDAHFCDVLREAPTTTAAGSRRRRHLHHAPARTEPW